MCFRERYLPAYLPAVIEWHQKAHSLSYILMSITTNNLISYKQFKWIPSWANQMVTEIYEWCMMSFFYIKRSWVRMGIITIKCSYSQCYRLFVISIILKWQPACIEVEWCTFEQWNGIINWLKRFWRTRHRLYTHVIGL